jgi:lysophospholipase L1-like esterase
MWLAPNDTRLLYSDYLHLHKDSRRAVFDRCFDPQWPCRWLPETEYARNGWQRTNLSGPFAEMQTPGATVSFETDATAVTAHLEYSGDCRPGCPSTQWAGQEEDARRCYDPLRKGNAQPSDVCEASCVPILFVDGVRRQLPPTEVGAPRLYIGAVAFDLAVDEAAPMGMRRFELSMPWGAATHLAGLRLARPPTSDGITVQRPPPRGRFTYIAYGDSITHGYCAETPYPGLIGRLNNWTAINLGWGGIRVTPRHGPALGAIPADLISMLIGTNDYGGGNCEVAAGLSETLNGIREAQPDVPLVVITMIVRREAGDPHGDCSSDGGGGGVTLEQLREQLRREVNRRIHAGDRNLHLVEGGGLLSLGDLGDGLHPAGTDAMEKLARGINAHFHRLGLARTFHCYAERYPHLLEEYCGGTATECDWVALQRHWDQHGRVGGLRADCDAPPPPPPPPPHSSLGAMAARHNHRARGHAATSAATTAAIWCSAVVGAGALAVAFGMLLRAKGYTRFAKVLGSEGEYELEPGPADRSRAPKRRGRRQSQDRELAPAEESPR